MSRSRKKNPIIKDGSSWWKKHSNRVFRRRNKIQLSKDEDFLQRDELVNRYDICDWIFIWNEDSKWFKRSPEFWTEERLAKLKREYFNK